MCSIMAVESKTISPALLAEGFEKTLSRGPDMSRIIKTKTDYLCFYRLAIMGLAPEGMQPFFLGEDAVICNGELYGFRPVREKLKEKYSFQSESDCEILLPLYHEYGLSMFEKLDAEFALVLYDGKTGHLIAARDPIGIRPLFYGCLPDGGIAFASEAKNLVGLTEHVFPFPPGHYYAEGKFVRYCDVAAVSRYCTDDVETLCAGIRERLIEGVEKRLDADAPLGFLLSGGLDSSLVCAISARLLKKPIRTFAIGMDTDAIDLRKACFTESCLKNTIPARRTWWRISGCPTKPGMAATSATLRPACSPTMAQAESKQVCFSCGCPSVLFYAIIKQNRSTEANCTCRMSSITLPGAAI